MSREINKVEVTDTKVKIVVVERNYWGSIVRRQQMTFKRRHFEQAMANAGITVPWSRVRP